MLECHAACSAGAAVELGIGAEPLLDLVGLCDDAPYDVDRGLDEDLLLDLRRNHLPPKHSATQSCASLVLYATMSCVIAIWLGWSGLSGRRMQMRIGDKTVLVTGGNRGIGKALGEEALSPLPLTPAYALSKAAAFNLTQSLRALLAPQGVKVHAVLTGPTDTDMTRGLNLPKASPESVARAILDGVEKEEEDIFPDPLSASMAASWRGSAAKAMERQLASFVQAA